MVAPPQAPSSRSNLPNIRKNICIFLGGVLEQLVDKVLWLASDAGSRRHFAHCGAVSKFCQLGMVFLVKRVCYYKWCL